MKEKPDLQAQLEIARTALEPFARIANEVDAADAPTKDSYVPCSIRLGDLLWARQAYRALASTESKPNAATQQAQEPLGEPPMPVGAVLDVADSFYAQGYSEGFADASAPADKSNGG